MLSFRRSLPGTISSEAPPVTVSSEEPAAKMAGTGFVNFSKTFLLPIFIATALYLLLFHALLPLYRRHRARYSQYLPLRSAAALSSRLPEALQPSSLRDRITDSVFRVILPSTWAYRSRFQRRESVGSTEEALFDDESGEAMVGFDVEERTRRRDGMDRQVSQGINAAREMGGYSAYSQPRLSRELEEGFRDESDDEAEESTVTAGRRSFSASR